jgi:hypothetical protein
VALVQVLVVTGDNQPIMRSVDLQHFNCFELLLVFRDMGMKYKLLLRLPGWQLSTVFFSPQVVRSMDITFRTLVLNTSTNLRLRTTSISSIKSCWFSRHAICCFAHFHFAGFPSGNDVVFVIKIFMQSVD